MGENFGLGPKSNPEGLKAEEIRVEDFEATPRELRKGLDIILGISMVALSIFQLYTSYVGPFPDLIQRGIHLFFVLPAAFIMYPAFKKSPKRNEIPFVDWILMILSVITTLWVIINYERIRSIQVTRQGSIFCLAPFMIIVIMEATRRILGPVLPTLVLLLIVYALLGPYLPGRWAHRGFSLGMVLQSLYLEPDGIFGYVVGISAEHHCWFLNFWCDPF